MKSSSFSGLMSEPLASYVAIVRHRIILSFVYEGSIRYYVYAVPPSSNDF